MSCLPLASEPTAMLGAGDLLQIYRLFGSDSSDYTGPLNLFKGSAACWAMNRFCQARW